MISAKTHVMCRGRIYPRSKVIRALVPDDKVPWEVDWPDYSPVSYTAPHLTKPCEELPSWADPENIGVTFQPKWNVIDGKINRKSHLGEYEIINNVPRNPKGRTGIKGRGCLGRWGPNHAADPIVTRWKRENDDTAMSDSLIHTCHTKTSLPILQFVAIKRKDCGEWAIPGGMVDPGEDYTSTLLREFLEEALNIEDSPNLEERRAVVNQVSRDVAIRHVIHNGYVDDPRNTDNAWMETMAVNFHQPPESSDDCLLPLKAGSDAAQAEWVDICETKHFYANHGEFLQAVVLLRGARW